MNKEVKRRIIILISCIIIFCNTISISKYNRDNEYVANTKIAKAILKVENDEKIDMKISKNNLPKEYFFSICNYENESINEIDFEYEIILENSSNKFPISYKIFDCDNNIELKLNNGKTERVKIGKNRKEKRNFKIVFEWRELIINLEEEFELKMKVNGYQEEKNK